MNALTNINRTSNSMLPQDAIFPRRIKCPANSTSEEMVVIDKFFNLYLQRLYVSAKSRNGTPGDALYMSLCDGYSGREIFKRIPLTQFSPGFANGANARLLNRDNLRHYFREQAPIRFTIENESGNDYTVDLTMMGQRWFTGQNQGSEFKASDGVFYEDDIGTKGESRKIEYEYIPKPVAFKFVAKLRNGVFTFDVESDVNSGEYAAYRLNPLSMYKLSQISVTSSLPDSAFAGSITGKLLFNIRTTKKQSMIALPFEFGSHILPTDIESYLYNNNSDDVFLVGNLYGTVRQTADIVRLGCDTLSVIVNCVLYEGKENGILTGGKKQ